MTANLSNNRPLEDVLDEINDRITAAAKAAGKTRQDILLMAVTKTVMPELVNRAIAHGVTLLGENRAQELTAKYDAYDKTGVQIHFIGALQSNKVRQIIDKVGMIQSVDKFSLAREIDRQAKKHGKVMDVLIEVNIGDEQSKAGVAPENLEALIHQIATLEAIRVRGLMAIPPLGAKPAENERYFARMKQLYIDIEAQKIDNVDMRILSMGMSADYEQAIRCGANLVRLGSVLFGARTP